VPRDAGSAPQGALTPPAVVPDSTSIIAGHTLGEALAYQRHGWSVLPARIGSKHPLVSWTRWQQVAPDAAQLIRLWRRRPRANIALITGAVSGVVVLDIDPRHGGDDSLAKLERQFGDVPWLAVVETPSRGWHVYLQHPGGKVSLSAGKLGPGLDVRGDRGVAMLPPSRRGDGAYRWAVGSPANVPPMPEWMPALVRPAEQPPAARRSLHTAAVGSDGSRDAARLAGLLRTLQQAQEGQRNQTLYWAGCRLAEMLDHGAPESWTDVLVRAGVAIGLDQREARDTVRSALSQDL
jgi:hypothetical protein